QMNITCGEPADDAGGERQGDRERRGDALRHVLERGYSMHGPTAVVTAARVQIHHHPRAARMRAGVSLSSVRPRESGHPVLSSGFPAEARLRASSTRYARE